jgi:hypothetical protein
MTKQEKDAAITTLLFWMVMIAIGGMVLSAPSKKSEYTTISVQLNTPVPVMKKSLEQSVAKTDTASSQSSVPAKKAEPAKKTDTSVKKAEPIKKTQPVAKSTTPVRTESAPVKQTLQKSVDELIKEQNASISDKSTESVDWDKMFADSNKVASSSTSATPSNSSALSSSEALTGSVASVSSDTSASASSTTSQSSKSVSTSTLDALSSIKSSDFSDEGSGNGITSTVSVVSEGSKTGGTAIKMSDGSMRKLLDPLRPVLTISEENEKLINSSRAVVIKFIVKADGNVLPTSINFTPSGLLPFSVQSELRIQIAKWRFEKGAGDGQAEFKYSINKQ